MNKILAKLCCCFILNKEKRHKFRNKYIKREIQVNYEIEKNLTIERPIALIRPERLLELKWWNYDLKDIKHLDFTNVESCIKELEKMKSKNY